MIEYAADVEIHVRQHGRVDLHSPSGQLPLLLGQLFPWRNVRESRERRNALSDNAHLFHARQTLCTDCLVPCIILTFESVEPIFRRSEGAVHGLERQISEEWFAIVFVLVNALNNEIAVSFRGEVIVR